jgi:hypothetical protein
MTLLPWFPPAPAAGPASILSLPPDDWVMQPKIDGIRVIIYRGEPFTRLGQPLTASKGAAQLRAMFKGLDETLDGEWVPKEGKYYAFDLPDAPGEFRPPLGSTMQVSRTQDSWCGSCGQLRRSLRANLRHPAARDDRGRGLQATL